MPHEHAHKIENKSWYGSSPLLIDCYRLRLSFVSVNFISILAEENEW